MARVLWQDLVDFLNSCDRGEIVTRKEILNTINPDGYFSQHSIDKLRRMLTVQGYLSEVLDSSRKAVPGKYRLMKAIPHDLTSNSLERQAYPSCTPF